jgi:rhodanese-related sulfurtransferase
MQYLNRCWSHLLCFCLSVGLWFLTMPHPATLAAPAAPTLAVTSPPEVVAESVLTTAIQEELHNIPRGFYGILDIDQFNNQLKTTDVFLIDVRQPSEFRAGHIAGAVNFPLRELADHLDEIPKQQPVILYCSTGYRTGIGVMALHLLGYENVQGFPPSYVGWKQAQGTD